MFVREHVAALLASSFPNLSPQQVRVCARVRVRARALTRTSMRVYACTQQARDGYNTVVRTAMLSVGSPVALQGWPISAANKSNW